MVDNTLEPLITTDYVRKFQAITVALQKFNNTHNKHTYVITAAKNVTLLNIYIISQMDTLISNPVLFFKAASITSVITKHSLGCSLVMVCISRTGPW
jgi:hypothetical protein